MTTDKAKIEATKLALKNMFSEKKSFSICTIDTCCDLMNVIPNGEIYRTMRTVHCVDFKDMKSDFRDWLYKQTILMFCEPGFDLELLDVIGKKAIDVKIIEEKSSMFGFLK